MKKIKWLTTLLVVASIALGIIGCSSPSEPSSPSGPSGSGKGETQGAIVPEMVEVKGGTITGAKNSNNYPGVFIKDRTVSLSDFYMGKYQVTQ